MYNIPLFELNFSDEEIGAVSETINSKWISTGPKCEEFEKKFAEMLGTKNAVSLANCTTSLHLSLKILGVGEGDEVIVPALTFVATANSVLYTGAKPVFADILSREDLNIDPEDVEKKITKKTKAIIVMHYAGFPVNMSKIMKIAEKYNLKVIEDACHGPLSEYEGMKLGTIGDIGCFSFFSNKNISTGEGGMLVTNNMEYYKRTKLLRSHGMTSLSYQRASGHTTQYDVVDLGYNYRMDDMRASIGIIQLDKLNDDLKKRAEIRKYYIKKLNEIEDIHIPFKDHQGFVSNYIMPIVLKNSDYGKREIVREVLKSKGIQTSVHYPAVHLFNIYKPYKTSLANTEYAADNEITLPMFGRLSSEEIDYIVETLKTSL